MRTRSQLKSVEELPKAGAKRKQRPSTTTKKTTRAKKKHVETKIEAEPEAAVPTKRTTRRNAKVGKVLSKAKQKQIVKDERIDQQLSTEEPTTTRLAGVDKNLVNIVRRRELQHKQDIENCTKEKLHLKSLLCRMAEFCNHIRSFYRLEKKSVLEWNYIINKLCEMSSPAVQRETMLEIITLLVEIANNWCSIITVSGKEYLKLNNQVNVKEAKQKIQERIDALGNIDE